MWWKYVKAAFGLKTPVPVVGPLPLNLLALSCGAIVGFAYPPLWFAVAGLELVYLFWTSSNPRFRTVIDGMEADAAKKFTARTRDEIAQTLSSSAVNDLTRVEGKYNKIIAQYKRNTGNFVVGANADALARLMTMYLQLLVSAKSLKDAIDSAESEDLDGRVATLQREIGEWGLSEQAKATKQKTLDIMQQRAAAHHLRKQNRQEVISDLERIEAQIDLALETASTPVAITSSIDFVSDMISSDTTFGTDDGQQQILYTPQLER
jgi:hypothetical protein